MLEIHISVHFFSLKVCTYYKLFPLDIWTQNICNLRNEYLKKQINKLHFGDEAVVLLFA